jgi:hypothetical protein
MAVIDKKYRKEKLFAWEIQSFKDKHISFSLFKKSTWLIIVTIFAFAFILPFIPPRFGWSKWKPPATLNEYQDIAINFLIVTLLLFVGVFTFVTLRRTVEFWIGSKWIANFRVAAILNTGVSKILFLNGWRPFVIKAKESYFNSVKMGDVITIKRTCTWRRMDYYIRGRKEFEEEQTYK